MFNNEAFRFDPDSLRMGMGSGTSYTKSTEEGKKLPEMYVGIIYSMYEDTPDIQIVRGKSINEVNGRIVATIASLPGLHSQDLTVMIYDVADETDRGMLIYIWKVRYTFNEEKTE